MAVIDFTPLSEILPLLIFLVVFILTFAVLNKTKVIENAFMQLLIAFLLSTIFITATGARDYVEVVTPWFAILLVCLFFIMAVMGFIGKDVDFMKKGIGSVFVAILILAFVVSGIFIFSTGLRPYFGAFFSSPRLYSGVLLIVIAAAVGWVLLKSVGKK